jgi:hypothetical protein
MTAVSGVRDEGVTLVDEIEDIAGGSSQSLTVNLDAGSYALICRLAGHYQQGCTRASRELAFRSHERATFKSHP